MTNAGQVTIMAAVIGMTMVVGFFVTGHVELVYIAVAFTWIAVTGLIVHRFSK